MANTTLPALLDTGDHASRPAASAVGTGALYSCTDHSLVYQTDGSTWTTWATLGGGGIPLTLIDAAGDLILGSAADTAARLAIGTSGYVLTSNGTTAAWAAASGGAPDPITDKFGAADSAYEFSTSTSGLTSLSTTPDVMDSDTTVPDALFIRDNASGISICGAYAAATPPFTVITKLLDTTVRADYNYAGLFVGEATPGKMRMVFIRQAARQVGTLGTNNPTGSGIADITANAADDVSLPAYFAIVVNSSTDIDFAFSHNGYVWILVTDAHNPSATIGSAGVAIESVNANGVSAAFDYLRIWNSALTLPGY